MSRKRLSRYIALGVLILILALAVKFVVGVVQFKRSVTPTTEVSEYQTLLDQWRPLGVVDHFPPAIPPDATDVRLSAFPGFLQGGAWFQVQMTLPPGRVEAVEREYQGQSIAGRESFNRVILPSFRTVDDGETLEFPGGYRMIVLNAEEEGVSWHHGRSAGVAISRERDEVVYWAEDW